MPTLNLKENKPMTTAATKHSLEHRKPKYN